MNLSISKNFYKFLKNRWASSAVFCLQVVPICLLILFPYITNASLVNTPNSSTASGGSLQNGLVGWWTFDGKNLKTSVADSSGNGNHGALQFGTLGNKATSSMVTAGKIGQGLKFDGVDDYVNVSNLAAPSSDVTVTYWFKTSQPVSYPDEVILALGDTNAYFDTTGIESGRVRFSKANGATVSFATVATFNDNKWHMVAINTASNFIYVDGVNQATTTAVYHRLSIYRVIGARYVSGLFSQFFNGSLDDVRIYNRVLSVSEIKQLYNLGSDKVNQSPPSINSGLVGWWTFDGKNLKTSVADLSVSGNNGALQFGTLGNISTSSMVVAGKIGQALKFDNADDYVNLDVSKAVSKGNSQVTLSAWVYLNSILGAQSIYIDLGSGGGYRLGCGFSSGTPYCGGRAPDAQSYQQWTAASGVISAKKWYHFAAVIDVPTDSVKFYINGALKTNNVNGDFTNSAFDATNPNSSKIGFYSNQPFNGLIDDLRTYSRALSASEIKQLYNLGSDKVNQSLPSINSGLVGWWTFDGKDTSWTSATAATTLDKSGNYATGTLTNMNRATAPTAGKIGQGLKFDGVDDYVVTPSISASGLTGLTYSFWIKVPSVTNSGPVVLDWAVYRFCRFNGNGDLYQINCSVDGSSTGSALIAVSLNDNKWHHITYTSTTNSQVIYLDGVQKNMASETLDTAHSGVMNFGRFTSGSSAGSYYKGSIDDVRFYNRALSAAEVKQLYNAGR